jgi:hypothetical protein
VLTQGKDRSIENIENTNANIHPSLPDRQLIGQAQEDALYRLSNA